VRSLELPYGLDPATKVKDILACPQGVSLPSPKLVWTKGGNLGRGLAGSIGVIRKDSLNQNLFELGWGPSLRLVVGASLNACPEQWSVLSVAASAKWS
jgi:hypothetical protein